MSNPDGSLPPYWGFLRDVCAQFPDHAVVGAMARYADGTERPLSLAQTIVWQGDQDFWKDPPANTNYWPHMPPLGAMTACFDASGKPLFGTSAPACQRRSFRLLVEPRMDGKSPAGKLVFKLFPRPDLSYADRATYACADDCATRYDYLVDFEDGRQRTYVTFMLQGDNELKHRLVPKPLELDLGDAVPATLKGPMASEKDGLSTLLTADVAFTMKEVDLAGVLGFEATYDRAEDVPPPDLAALAPTYQLRLENRGAYLARYQITFTQTTRDSTGQSKSFRPTQTSGAVAAMQSVTFPVPATATDVVVRAEIIGTRQEIFRQTLGIVAGDGCLRTSGTLLGASVSGC